MDQIQIGPVIIASAVPSSAIIRVPAGKPSSQRVQRNPWARQKPGPNRPRSRARQFGPALEIVGTRASTSSSARASSASIVVKPRVAYASAIAAGITIGVTMKPKPRLQSVTKHVNQIVPSGNPSSR